MEFILVLLSFILGFGLVCLTIPSVIKVSHAKCLFDKPNERKIHKGKIPPIGGVAIFIGFTISAIVATDGYTFDSLKYIIASAILVFFIGLKDDLMDIPARKKLLVQIFSATMLITLGNIRLTFFHGMAGMYEIHYITSILFTLLVMLALVNAYNLIDGIDGLASGLAIIAAGFAGIWFYLADHFQFAVLSFALVGSLAGFFLFNVFGRTNKIFMGDTGSLLVGLIIATLIIKLNEFNIVSDTPYSFNSIPSLSLALIIIPVIDTLRVMTIRIVSGKSPFSPDKNHIHHRLLSLFPNHLTVTLIIVSANIFIIGLALIINYLSINVNLQFLIVFLSGLIISFIPSWILAHKNKKMIMTSSEKVPVY